MLFSAGYGIALLFFGVAEPVLHFSSPPAGAPETVDAAKQAMQIAFFRNIFGFLVFLPILVQSGTGRWKQVGR